jgi:hypothetical protein
MLLVHDSSTEGFVVTFAYIYIVQQFCSSTPLIFLFFHFPLEMDLKDFNVLDYCMYRKYLNHVELSIHSSFTLPLWL